MQTTEKPQVVITRPEGPVEVELSFADALRLIADRGGPGSTAGDRAPLQEWGATAVPGSARSENAGLPRSGRAYAVSAVRVRGDIELHSFAPGCRGSPS